MILLFLSIKCNVNILRYAAFFFSIPFLLVENRRHRDGVGRLFVRNETFIKTLLPLEKGNFISRKIVLVEENRNIIKRKIENCRSVKEVVIYLPGWRGYVTFAFQTILAFRSKESRKNIFSLIHPREWRIDSGEESLYENLVHSLFRFTRSTATASDVVAGKRSPRRHLRNRRHQKGP